MLLVEAGGESASDYESDAEVTIQQKEGDMFGEYAYRRDKIFKYLTIKDKRVTIPDSHDNNRLTLFIEPEDIFLHTFICDENFGYLVNPSAKDPEHEFFLEEIGQPVLVYMRDYWEDFMDYLKKNQDWIEPIIYTSALQPYNKHIMKIIDPNQEVFKTRLY